MDLPLRSTLVLCTLALLTPFAPRPTDAPLRDGPMDRPLRFAHACAFGHAHDERVPHAGPEDFAPEARGRAKIIEGDIITWDPEAIAGDEGSSGPYHSTFGATAWPGGLVPYVFGGNTNTSQQNAMRLAMDELETVAAVTFVPRTGQSNYLSIVDSTGNSSWIGMIGGAQTVNIYNWNYKYIMEHELLHALGFWHEQSRPDRDTYVQINYANVIPQYSHNFDRNPSTSTHGTYDFESIMHYGRTAFSANGQDTITVLAPNQAMQTVIGNRAYLSTLDAAGLAHIYGAPGGNMSVTVTAPNGGEQWDVGQPATITWTSQNLSPNVRIELSRDGGLQWETLFESTPNDGQETWGFVTAPETTQALVRVTDAANASEHDSSDAFFSVVDSRPTITSELTITQAKLRLVGAGSDQFKVQAMWNASGVGLGIEGGTTTLTLRDDDTPSNEWTVAFGSGALVNSGSRWTYKDSVQGVQVVFDTLRHRLTVAAKGQTLPFQNTTTLELELDAPNFDAEAQWPADPTYRAGRSTPEEDVFFVSKAQVVRGKSSGTDKLRVEGLFRPENGFLDPNAGLVRLELGMGYSTSFDAGELVNQGTRWTYRSSTGSGIVKFQIDTASGAFRLDVRNANLAGISTLVDVRFEVSDAVGETTLAMRGNPFSKLQFP